jgi:hypothetical protein
LVFFRTTSDEGNKLCIDQQDQPSSISQAAAAPLLTAGEHTYVISNDGSLPSPYTSSLSCARTIGDWPQGHKVQRRSVGVGALRLLSPVPSAALIGALSLDHDLPADMDGHRPGCPKDEFQPRFLRSYITCRLPVSASDVYNQPS